MADYPAQDIGFQTYADGLTESGSGQAVPPTLYLSGQPEGGDGRDGTLFYAAGERESAPVHDFMPSGASVRRRYVIRGRYVAGSTYELFPAEGLPPYTPPSLHALDNVSAATVKES